MRQRVEDLGRLAVLIRNLLDHQLFDEGSLPRRPKDYWEWFSELSEDKKGDVLHAWAYGIAELSEKLYEMLSIAEGTDCLNESD
jgi:hypothetical protein